MTAILAIETATDACSIALYRDGQYQQLHELSPRQHAQRLFPMLDELLQGSKLLDAGLDALAYGNGPGSFTGLRIAASAVQGLAYAGNLPAVPVSTLACQAATALRHGIVDGEKPILSTIDARINEIYWALYTTHDHHPQLQLGPFAGPAAQLAIEESWGRVDVVGSGCLAPGSFPAGLGKRFDVVDASLLPEAGDLVPFALADLEKGRSQAPLDVQPVYVRDEISWKKLSEQGKGR